MRLRHIGVRPTYELQVLDFKRKLWIEEFPDNTYKIWNTKLLNSGCGKVTDKDSRLMRPDLYGCYYCIHCEAWFSKDQWESV